MQTLLPLLDGYREARNEGCCPYLCSHSRDPTHRTGTLRLHVLGIDFMEIFMAIESGLRRKSASEPGVGKECFGVGELGRLGG